MIAPNELRRSGVTLIEVLVAIFVAAIGLLALLALFPVGALSMRQALKDSRCAQLCTNAMAQYRSRGIGQDLNVVQDYSTGATIPDSFIAAINAVNLGSRPAITNSGPSYPVYVDPLGVSKSNNHIPVYHDVASFGVSTPSPYPRIPRHNVSYLNTSEPFLTQYLRAFSLLDDIYFGQQGANAGKPDIPQGAIIFQRDPRYTFAYMLRRPLTQVSSTMEVTVVVYVSRSLSTSLAAAEENGFFPITFSTGSTQVNIPYGQMGLSRPTVKSGGWILDATMLAPLATNPMLADPNTPEPHGFFYRVVDVIDGVDSNNLAQVTLELQTAPRLNTTVGQLVVLDNVAEVFEKGTISTP